jgi:hypothetical protein
MNRTLRLIMISALCLPSAAFPAINVLTWHNNLARNGQNLGEKQLTPTNVNFNSFGKLFQINVDGKVDAQPLIVSNVSIPNRGTHNVVIIATEHDTVYCCDADFGTILWRRSMLRSGETPSDSRGCDQVVPEIGITATPVIDLLTGPHGTIFVVAMSKNATSYFQRIHALDLVTGAEQFGGPVRIKATYPGTGDNNNGQGQVIFDPKQYKERPGLVLSQNVVYTFWASHCDQWPYTGWIIGYDKNTLARVRVVNLTPNGHGGAIWGSGAAPAVDGAGKIYLLNGNGTFETSLNASRFPSMGDFGNCIVKLSNVNLQLRVADYWTMYNTVAESQADEDLGSGGAVLLPPMIDLNGVTRYLLAGAGKDKHIYIADRDNLGKFVPTSNATLYQNVTGALAGPVFSVPAYFNGHLYYGAVNDHLKSFAFSNARLVTSPTSKSLVTFGYPGTTPSISANGTANAIAWAAANGTPAVLYAFDATNLAKKLYSSNDAGTRDHFGTGNKFIVPTVANGKVYVGTTSSVGVFGLLDPPRLSNLSARAVVPGGQNPLVLGFTIQGSESKTVGVRVLGPSLPLDGSSAATRLSDPVLELRDDNGRVIDSNDNWEANNSEIARLQGTEPGPHNQKEPAIVASLSPGDYTLTVRDANNAAGTALAEVYDLSTPLTSNFANFYARGFVGTGDEPLIGGIVVRGTATEQVLFRAIGPDLGNSGIANALPDPVLEIRDNNGMQVAFNDNWRESPQAEEISSLGLTPDSETDAALLLTLIPGNYTAVVRDAAGSTGVAQLETYELR